MLWNPTQAYNGGGQDAFLTRFNSDANQFVFSTYLGGSGGGGDTPELGSAIALDPFNNVYVAGTTSSLNFPLLLPYQSTHGGGGQDAWLRKLDSGGVKRWFRTLAPGTTFESVMAQREVLLVTNSSMQTARLQIWTSADDRRDAPFAWLRWH